MELMSIREAAAKGISLLRKPVWADPCAHMKIDIVDGEPGPWTHLYDPYNQELNGRDPVDVLCIQMDYDAQVFVQHVGPTHDSPEYHARAAQLEELNRRGSWV